jgi:hypothetical protein
MELQTIEASSVPAGLLPIPRTQKARGIAALARHHSGDFVPPFSVHSASQVRPEQLVGYFSRPCPMRPRHGFVDSRRIASADEGSQLIRQTLEADPDAEIVTMPLVNAAFSGIWTRGSLTVGLGNDGATAGTSAWSVPSLGDLVTNLTMDDAGIRESPYVEVLWPAKDPGYRLVQLRDGPDLPLTTDFVPYRVQVERVLLADGHLLDWEGEMRHVEPGTVVYHPNGSLASHYAIHAVLNRVPLLISREPQIGEVLEPEGDTPRPADIQALQAGFAVATTLEIDYAGAVRIMLTGCHHLSVWTGKHDDLLGLALGCAYRLTIAAALGEMRHVPNSGKDRDDLDSRDYVYETCWDKMQSAETRSAYEQALRSFHELVWLRGYGGAKWFFFARWAAVLHNHLVQGEAELALQALNQLVHCAHNSGWAFDKFIPEEALTQTARNPISSLIVCAPLLYEAHSWMKQSRAALARHFSHTAMLVSIPDGQPNFETFDDEDREDDWSEERSSDEPVARRSRRLVRRGAGTRSRIVRREPVPDDIPF